MVLALQMLPHTLRNKMKIFKYEIPIAASFDLQIPWGFTALSFQVQNGFPVLWAAVNENHTKNTYTFKLVGTGQQFEFNELVLKKKYIGTIQLDDLVWHLFEV